MRRFLERSFALTLAGAIYDLLSVPKRIGSRQAQGNSSETFWIVGSLPLRAHGESGMDSVDVAINLSQNWMIIPPSARVFASFLREGADWHRFIDGSLCYVLQQRWEYELANVFQNQDIAKAIGLAAVWCVSALDSLTVRHLIGHRLHLEEWPNDWAFYKHGDLGKSQFNKEKERNYGKSH